MKKTLQIIILMVLMTAMLAISLAAQTLPVDSRKKEMQFHRNYELGLYSPTADTLYNRIAIPANSVEISLTAETGAVQVCADSTYITTSAFPKNYVTIAAGTTLKLPVIRANYIWIRRAAAGTASKAHIVFLKM